VDAKDWNCVHNFGSTHGEDTRNCCCRTVYHGVLLGPESRNCRVNFRHMVIGIAICLSFKACSIYWCILIRYTTEQNIFFLSGMLFYLLENCTKSCIENCRCSVIAMGEFFLLLCAMLCTLWQTRFRGLGFGVYMCSQHLCLKIHLFLPLLCIV